MIGEGLRRIVFGPFEIDPVERQLWRSGEEIALTGKAFDVLLLLVRNHERTVTKEEFMTVVWAGTIVEETNLTDNISTLRQVLGDDAREPKYIRTIPRRGYRFVAEVSDGKPDAAPATPVAVVASTNRSRPNGLPLLITTALIVMVIAAVATAVFRGNRQSEQTAAVPAPVAKSLAVLPFKPLVGEARDPALEMGMTDSLISRLSALRDVTIRPTSSVMKYASTTPDVITAGTELNVEALIDGKVQRSGDRVRLNVQLVRASDGATIWGATFDEKFTDIFAVQDAISQRVADALAIRLTKQERQGLAKRYTANVAAYQLYANGRYHWSSFSPDQLLTSIRYYDEALKIDPGYALAYSGIADAYSVIAIYGPLSAHEAMPKARDAARKALEIDPQLAAAHVSLAVVTMLYDWDWTGAEEDLRRAMELDPDNADAQSIYAYLEHSRGRTDEALQYLERARAQAPAWNVTKKDKHLGLLRARRYEAAIEECRREIQLDPARSTPYYILGEALMHAGRLDEAMAVFEKGFAIAQQDRLKSDIACVYALRGNRAKALELIEQLEKHSQRPGWRPVNVARVYAALRDHDHAFEWLAAGERERMPFLYGFRIDPLFDAMRSDPRYGALLRRMNLPAS
jgi:DNA-binding winged helix-turn-helix (wHTH) protein/TolB-like protein/Tfp pilus assembly protein PilF